MNLLLKFIYSEQATKLYEIFTLLLSYVVPVKSKVKIFQNFVAFSEYMNFIWVINNYFFSAEKTWKNYPQIGLNSQWIVYCFIGDTTLRNFYIMTLVIKKKHWFIFVCIRLKPTYDLFWTLKMRNLKSFPISKEAPILKSMIKLSSNLHSQFCLGTIT